jgi:hypothetical protein
MGGTPLVTSLQDEVFRPSNSVCREGNKSTKAGGDHALELTVRLGNRNADAAVQAAGFSMPGLVHPAVVIG